MRRVIQYRKFFELGVVLESSIYNNSGKNVFSFDSVFVKLEVIKVVPVCQSFTIFTLDLGSSVRGSDMRIGVRLVLSSSKNFLVLRPYSFSRQTNEGPRCTVNVYSTFKKTCIPKSLLLYFHRVDLSLTYLSFSTLFLWVSDPIRLRSPILRPRLENVYVVSLFSL